MKRYAGQILNDSLRDFDATLNLINQKMLDLHLLNTMEM